MTLPENAAAMSANINNSEHSVLKGGTHLPKLAI